MQYLDIAGVKRFKQYTDDTFVTTDDYSVVDDPERDTYTKQEIDAMLTDIDGEDKVFIFNVTTNSSATTSSATFQEIYAACNSGKSVFCIVDNILFFTLDTYINEYIRFTDVLPDGSNILEVRYVGIDSSNNITVGSEAYHIPDVDSTPTSKSYNVVSSDGVYTALSGKQDTLVSGTNIKTINNQSLLGSGDITISGVQSDWNATSGLAQILNKPTLATVATTGSYSDLSNKPTIPSAVTESTVSDWGFTKNVGTITGITMNGSSKGTSGVIDLGTVVTSETDPTVPAWAKAATKPTYTASEVGAATQSDINQAISDLVGTAPEALNTLGEIADALNNDSNLASTLTNQISVKYTKPENGIPKSDLASTVQTSLEKADTALQSETDPVFSASVAAGITANDITNWNNKTSNTGTLTGVTFNGTAATVNDGTAAIIADIPYSLSSLQDDSSHRLVTDAEKTTWNNKVSANDSTITIQKGGTTVDSFTTNASSGKTINIPNELPSFTSSNNGQILMVVNGALAWVSPSVIYSGNTIPDNSNGANGDIYLQS